MAKCLTESLLLLIPVLTIAGTLQVIENRNSNYFIDLNMGTKTSKWIKIITVLFIAVLLLYDANNRFSERDTDSGIFFSLAAFSFILSGIFFFFQKKKVKSKEQSVQEKTTVSDKTILTIFIAIIILGFTIFQLFIRIDNYFEEVKEREEDKKEVIENHQRWMNEMNYHLDNLSEHHYLYLRNIKEERFFESFLKVLEIKDSTVKLAIFDVRGYNRYNLLPRLIEESYINDDRKDTIVITKEQLKKSIVSNSDIREFTYSYKDSLRNEGLIYTTEDIHYINGPSLSRQYESADRIYGKGDTTYFSFKNLNKRAHLKQIVNISGDFQWHTKLPLPIAGFQLNSDNNNVEFILKATNVDFSQDYEFKMYFEDSLKNQHIFLVTKRFEDSPTFYESNRVFD